MPVSPRRQHILFLIPTLRAGGAERVIVTLLKNLNREKFRLTLGVIDGREPAFGADLPGDVVIKDFAVSRVRYALPKIVSTIWRVQPDVIFSTLGHLNLALALIKPLLPPNIRFIARETSIVSERVTRTKLSFLRSAYKELYTRFDGIIAQCEYMRDDLVIKMGVPASTIMVINNPLDISNIKRLACCPIDYPFDPVPDEDYIKILAVGRLCEVKGFDLLIEALALSKLQNLRVTVLGEGPLRKALEHFARSKGVHQQIRFIGVRRNPYAFMARSDALLLCSRSEGFPNVVLEALVCGTQVIATPAPGGIAEIAQSTGGVRLASAVSAEALSAELVSFTKDRASIPPINLERFCVAKITKRYEQLLAGNARDV